jgi:putative colanic acid biosynthesis UDP-glucose lipid carrier transferase
MPAYKEMEFVGIFDGQTDGACDRPGITELQHLCRVRCIDEVLVALPWPDPDSLNTTIMRLSSTSVNIKLAPDLPKIARPYLSFDNICGAPVLSVVERPLKGWQCAIKRLEDVVLSVLALIVMMPIMLIIAFLIRLESPGPVIFRQERWGFNGNKITVLKFRTMRVASVPDPHVVQAQRNDPRVSRIGTLLRRTSLDELPQFINVLRGDMSLVGPRPHAIAHNEYYSSLIDNYLARHRLKPGITGLAQINGYRGITDTLEKMQKRVEYDLMYIENWSLLLDFKILFLTLLVGFVNPNAY